TWRGTASGPSGLHQTRCLAVRVLHAGDGDELRGAPGAQPRPDGGRRPCRDQRAYLPLRHLSARRRRDAGCFQDTPDVTMAKDDTQRTETFPFGIASVGLSDVQRQIPLDEPPPLPPNAD